MQQRINMSKFGTLRWRFTVEYDNERDYGNFRYTKYNEDGKVVKREEGKNISLLFMPGDRNKFINSIMYNLVSYLKERELYGEEYRNYICDESPETIVVTHYETTRFKDISRSEIYFKRYYMEMIRSSYSAIFPADITDELRAMKFKYGDLWALVYINYVNGRPSKTELYLYSVNIDKIEDLVKEIEDAKKYTI